MTASLYRTDFPNHCQTHAIDGMTLVFHRPSGATHFLDSPIPELLALLTETPLNAIALGRALCEQLELPYDDEAQAVVDARLAELVASGLAQAG